VSDTPIRDWYLRRIVGNVPFMLGLFDGDAGCFRCEPGHDRDYQHAVRPLAYLYAHKIDGNPYHRDASILDKVIREGDAICDSEQPSLHGTLGAEWVPLNLLQAIEWVDDELDAKRRARWTDAIWRHLEQMKLVSNYLATAPNHFIWRAALLVRAGQMFDNDNWRRTGQLWARQICRMQLPDGYWDESRRGQGPSPNYHRTQLHGLDLYYRFSNNPEVKDVLYKGIEFAVRAAYPDGTPIETLDGRQPYVAAFAVGMAANALTRTPQGRRLIRNQIRRMDELGLTDAKHPCGFALTWYVFATTDFMVDCHRFAEDGPDTPLPQEDESCSNVFPLNGQAGAGGAVTTKRGPWMLAVSAAETDVPRFGPHVYITERQSMFSAYHDAAGLIVGGGNRMRNHVPLANAHVITGWRDVDCVGGVFGDHLVSHQGLPVQDGTTEANSPVKGCYHPIQRRAEIQSDGATLWLEFLHAHIRFDLKVVSPQQMSIRYAFEAVSARKILLQVPIPLFHPGRFQIDGIDHQVGDMEDVQTLPVTRNVRLGARGCTVDYTPADGDPVLFTYPLQPINNWKFNRMNYVPDVHFKPLYTVGLLSHEFHGDEGRGTLLTIDVETPQP